MTWNCGFRATFRLYPNNSGAQDQLDVFLASDGRLDSQVLSNLPYAAQRVQGAGPVQAPNPKRYREPRQLFRTIGLVYDVAEEAGRRVVVTDLGRAVARWRSVINPRNAAVLARHAAQALAACQLRNSSYEAKDYGPEVRAFPFAYIWRAMLALDDRISSTELNTAIFYAMDEDGLADAIERVRRYRSNGDSSALRPPIVAPGAGQNDRIIPWMAWASFGWTLIHDKKTTESDYYALAPELKRVVVASASVHHRHRDFGSEQAYVEYISSAAGLPKDLR